MTTAMHPKGSEWRKWDLHVHTPESFQYSYDGADSFKKISDNIKKSDCSCFAISDYNTLDGYKKIRDSFDIGDKVTFPAIEFRMKNLLVERSSQSPTPINFHIIFTNDLTKYTLIESFLSSLEFYDFNNSSLNFRREDIISLGRQIDSKESDEQKLYKIGLAHVRVDFDKVLEKLIQKGLKDYSLILIPFDEYGGIDSLNSISEGLIKSNFIKRSHIVGSGSLIEKDYFLGYKTDKYTEDQFKLWVGNPKPCIKGSDSHHPDSVGIFPKDQDGKEKCCWIKADTTFEGLRQIVLEPDLRVKIQTENPSDFETYSKIDKLILNFPSKLNILEELSKKKITFCLSGKYELHFSNNLNCLIGGRGSGKSAIVHTLYNSWNKRENGKLEDVNSALISLDFSDKDSLTAIRELVDVNLPESTEFYLQNEIESFAKSLDAMSKLIRARLIKLSALEKNKENLELLKGQWDASLSKLSSLIEAYDSFSKINANIKNLKDNIKFLRKQTEVIKSKEYKEFQNEIEQLSEKISSFKRYSEECDDMIERLDSINASIDKVAWSAMQGREILDDLKAYLLDIKKKLEEKYQNEKTSYDKKKYSKLLSDIKDKLSKYLESKGISAENVEELTDANVRIKEFELQIRALEAEKDPYEKIYSKRNEILKDFKEDYHAYYKRYKSVCDSLETSLKALPFEDHINFTIITNYEKLMQSISQFIKDNISADIKFQSDEIQKVLFDECDFHSYIDNKKNIQKCVNKTQKAIAHKKIIQEFIANEDSLERLYLRIIKDYFDISNIQVQSKLGAKLLQNTSFGERCGLVIAIILVAGTNPVIVDQPEDHLDGKFISKILVPLIRKQKLNRQIILITRDANIVIGSDAELIHILDNVNQKTSITPSSIENVNFREKYVWILDGGKIAFQKRERKYNFI